MGGVYGVRNFEPTKAASGAAREAGIGGGIPLLIVWGLGQAGVEVTPEVAAGIAAVVIGLWRSARAWWKHG
jgi:hypothetical protein